MVETHQVRSPLINEHMCESRHNLFSLLHFSLSRRVRSIISHPQSLLLRFDPSLVFRARIRLVPVSALVSREPLVMHYVGLRPSY